MYQFDVKKILAKYVHEALVKKSGDGSGAISNALPRSKMVMSPHYSHMDEDEIEDDVLEFNRVWRSPRGKAQVSPTDVKILAEKIQSNFLSAEARRKESEFKQREAETRRKKEMVSRAEQYKTGLIKKVEARRQAESKKLDTINNKPGFADDMTGKIKDMDIG